MNAILKKILFIVAFILLTLFLPAIILLLFVDAAESFGVYVITFGVVIFGILGYIVASIRNMEKKIDDTMEEIKMQNAAIAYKLTNADADFVQNPIQQTVTTPVAENVVNTINIPLNPADPLIMPTEKKAESKAVADDGFDDFK